MGASPLISRLHLREPWGCPGDRMVLVHTRFDRLNGIEVRGPAGDQRQKDYRLGKYGNDHDAATRVVKGIINKGVLDLLADVVVASDKTPMIVFPHPAFNAVDSGHAVAETDMVRNAFPFVFANYLGKLLGLPVNDEIVQGARVGRTNMTDFPRFLFQPHFVGEVAPGGSFILVDDVFSRGGTLAALRSHIVRQGGTVVAVTTLAHGSGEHQKFAIDQEIHDMLKEAYGTGCSDFWRSEIGHDTGCLTYSEARFLVRWAEKEHRRARVDARLQFLRDRLAEAAAKGE